MSDGRSKSSKSARDFAEGAGESALALNPLVSLRAEDMFSAGTNLMRAMASQPQAMMNQWMSLTSDLTKVVTQSSEIAPDRKDRRFADSGWNNNIFSKGIMQSYLAWAEKLTETVEQLDLPDKDAARARLVTSLFIDTMSPSNNFFATPAAMRQLYETGGKSAVNGIKNMLTDLTENGGLPASVDTS